MKARISMCLALLALVATVGCGPFRHHGKAHNIPPASRLMEPGPGVGGPGPGIMMPPMPMACPPMLQVSSVQVLMATQVGMEVRWDLDGSASFASPAKIVPFRENFPPASIVRVKLTNIPGHEGVELFPTIELGPVTPGTLAFLEHNAIPIQFTLEDFNQVRSGNFVTKVIYLPDPKFQQLALAGPVAGPEILVSTRLDPGMDPIVEADRRGSILAIIRLGNKDIASGTGEADAGVVRSGYFNAARADLAMPQGTTFPPQLPQVPAYVAGMTAPNYGMPITGTPIGLPGPPHIPLGVPAGLQSHTIKNHTHQHIPGPVQDMRIHVKQTPGLSYPKPVSKVHIRENVKANGPIFSQPDCDQYECVP